jgi:hypothetical protein
MFLAGCQKMSRRKIFERSSKFLLLPGHFSVPKICFLKLVIYALSLRVVIGFVAKLLIVVNNFIMHL